ncbi:uncharacterized protein KD926_001537 [Aspergillus affinis]|uniref:uncharacterized protein n=1 Tax=Aspergillus affinis TaxID=1070780 RepID=UPI0022FE3435|nr:uncharacterized protein KD926_001537 [Aspergillus affinis]KAI9044306.1 hypothetical protein KD926_001537 [Aspergillus affinis]
MIFFFSRRTAVHPDVDIIFDIKLWWWCTERQLTTDRWRTRPREREPPPTNTQETNISFSVEDFQPRFPVEPLPQSRKRTRSGDAFTPSESTGRVTTREVWRLASTLKDIIHHQTSLIESTNAELLEIKLDQNILHDQNEKLRDEIKTLRKQSQTPTPPEKERNCVRISTQRSLVDPRDNDESEGNTFGRYLPTDAANNHIRTALLNAPSTQYAQVAGIGTTKTGYLIRFKDPESATAARNNSEWLKELGNNTKLVKPRFGIVVYRTPTADFDLENASA